MRVRRAPRLAIRTYRRLRCPVPDRLAIARCAAHEALPELDHLAILLPRIDSMRCGGDELSRGGDEKVEAADATAESVGDALERALSELLEGGRVLDVGGDGGHPRLAPALVLGRGRGLAEHLDRSCELAELVGGTRMRDGRLEVPRGNRSHRCCIF